MPRPVSRTGQEIDPSDVISVNTTEILLPVTVRDQNGVIARDLTREDFRVFEDGEEQSITYLSSRRVPVDVVLMVDTSSSVADDLDSFRRAVEGFAERLAPEDRLSLMKFDDRVELIQDWTTSRYQLHRALARVSGGMFTRFNEALYLAAREQFRSSSTRHAAIVLTDGIDSGRGSISFETALIELLRAQANVYVVSNSQIERQKKIAALDSIETNRSSTRQFNQILATDLLESIRVIDKSEKNLTSLVRATGGRLYLPKSFENLGEAYSEVAEELQHQYAIYYSPLRKTRDGKFRRVQVVTKNPVFKVSARSGYYAPLGH
jgi:VWFA-related protein